MTANYSYTRTPTWFPIDWKHLFSHRGVAMFAHIQHKNFPKGLLRSWKTLAESKILHLQSTLCEVAVLSSQFFVESGCNFHFNPRKSIWSWDSKCFEMNKSEMLWPWIWNIACGWRISLYYSKNNTFLHRECCLFFLLTEKCLVTFTTAVRRHFSSNNIFMIRWPVRLMTPLLHTENNEVKLPKHTTRHSII